MAHGHYHGGSSHSDIPLIIVGFVLLSVICLIVYGLFKPEELDPEDCPACWGRGRIYYGRRGRRSKPCEDCFGTGKNIAIEQYRFALERCPSANCRTWFNRCQIRPQDSTRPPLNGYMPKW